MKSGKWLLAALAAIALAATPAGIASAAEKDSRSPVFNKAGSSSGGPVSFSGSRSQGAHGAASDELPFSERMKKKKKELHDRIASAAREREIETRAMVEQANMRSAQLAAQESQQQSGVYGAPPSSEPPKTYVYDPDKKKNDDSPSIVVTPDSNTGQQDSGPFNVFKFNKKK